MLTETPNVSLHGKDGILKRDKAFVYKAMYSLLSSGSIKGGLRSIDGYCLIGSLEEVATRHFTTTPEKEAMIEAAIVELASTVRLRHTKFDLVVSGLDHVGKSSTSKREFLELWNDVPWRKAKDVLKLVHDAAAYYAREADAADELLEKKRLQEEVATLLAEKAALQTRIRVLEEDNKRLQVETGFWRKRALKRVESELYTTNAYLADIDKQLNKTASGKVLTTK